MKDFRDGVGCICVCVSLSCVSEEEKVVHTTGCGMSACVRAFVLFCFICHRGFGMFFVIFVGCSRYLVTVPYEPL